MANQRTCQKPFICPRCHGTGRSPMTAVYRKTLSAIKKLKRPTFLEVHKRSAPGGHLEVTYKRIDRLERWGVVRVLKEERPKRVELVED